MSSDHDKLVNSSTAGQAENICLVHVWLGFWRSYVDLHLDFSTLAS